MHAAQSYGCTICRPPRIWSRPARLSRLAYVSTISLHLVYDKPNMFSLACSARYWSLGFLLSSVSEGGFDIKERHIKVRTKTNCPKDTPLQPSSSQAVVQTQLASQWLLSFSWWSHITVMSLSPQKRGRNSDKWVHLRFTPWLASTLQTAPPPLSRRQRQKRRKTRQICFIAA